MGDVAYHIDKFFWAITFLLFISSMFYKLDVSARIALAIWIIGNLVMDKLQPTIMEWSISYDETGIWYSAWSSIELLCLWCIYKLHKVYNLEHSQVSKYIMLCLIALCALQSSRYIDRVILETNWLVEVYRFGIVAINISVVPVTLAWLINGIRYTRTTKEVTE